jgi:hypothetical protein
MKHINKIPFDEDIVLIMTSFINISQSIPKEAILLFPYLEKYLKKNKGLMPDLFELLNAYILYGTEMFQNNHDILMSFCDIIKKSLTEFSDYDKSSYLAYNLLSLLLQVIFFLIFLIIKFFL